MMITLFEKRFEWVGYQTPVSFQCNELIIIAIVFQWLEPHMNYWAL